MQGFEHLESMFRKQGRSVDDLKEVAKASALYLLLVESLVRTLLQVPESQIGHCISPARSSAIHA